MTALCPTTTCLAVSHLSCLSRHFLANEASSSSNADIIPRGGWCDSCDAYILWGDVIRGCYRRREGGVTLEAEQDDADEQDEDRDLRGQLFGDHREGEGKHAAAPSKSTRSVTSRRSTKQSKARAGSASASRPAHFSALAPCSSNDEREHFDLDNISSSSDEQQDPSDVDVDGRPQWHPVLPPKPAQPGQGSVPPRATPVYPRHWLRDNEDHRGPLASSHAPASHGRPPAQTAGGAGQPRFGFASAGWLVFSPSESAHSVAGKCVTKEYPIAWRARRQGNHARPTW